MTRGNERIARALDGMGCKRTRVILNERLAGSIII